MAITSRKITTYAKNIVDLSDQPNKDGLTAAQLKAFFDGRTDEEVKTSINGIVDDLVATTDGASGADQIGATAITGGTAVKVQGILEELNSLKAADADVVHDTGNETVAGVKTFSSSPIVPTPTTDMQASTKKYVDDAAAAKINTSAIVNDLTTGGATVPASAETVKTLKTQIGAQTFTEKNYVTDGASDTANIDALDMAAKDNADLISTNRTIINEKTSYGVYTGLVVAQQTTPDMTVKVSAGTIYMANGDRFTPSAVASLAVTAADATNPRIDIVYVSSLGAITYLAGTAAATPSAPSVPAGGQKIAEINVAAKATSIVTANIVDKRRTLANGEIYRPTFSGGWKNESSGIYYPVEYWKDSLGYVHIRGAADSGTAGTQIFVLAAGFRPLKYQQFSCYTGTTNTTGKVAISAGGIVVINSYSTFLDFGEIIFKAEG